MDEFLFTFFVHTSFCCGYGCLYCGEKRFPNLGLESITACQPATFRRLATGQGAISPYTLT